VESLRAAIEEEVATLKSLGSKVEKLVASLASDLKAAGTVRTKEATDFAAEEAKLAVTIDMLGRAINILEREMNSGAALVQVRNAGNLAQTFDAMVRASMITTGDGSRLTALVQDSQKARDADEEEAPDAPHVQFTKARMGTGGAALDQVSFVQLAFRKEWHRYEAVRLVRDLACKQKSGSLAQLASQLTATMQSKA